MVEFSLSLFLLALKRGRFEDSEPELQGLNAFITGWSVKLLKCTSEQSKLMTLRCLGYMLRVPLDAWAGSLMDVANASFKLLESNAASMGEVLNQPEIDTPLWLSSMIKNFLLAPI
jgi:hypothetical protein